MEGKGLFNIATMAKNSASSQFRNKNRMEGELSLFASLRSTERAEAEAPSPGRTRCSATWAAAGARHRCIRWELP